MLALLQPHNAAARHCAGAVRQPQRLRTAYDAVIIGGGVTALAAAYYLAREHSVRNIAVLEQHSLGSSGGNTTCARMSLPTLQNAQFYAASLRVWQGLSRELQLNRGAVRRSHFTLAHCETALRNLRWRAEVEKHHGAHCRLVDRRFIKAHLPLLDLECGGQWPVLGALYHQRSFLTRFDALAWGYACAAQRLGVELHQHTEVIGVDIANGAVVGVRSTRGRISTRRVLCAFPGHTPRILQMVGLQSPIRVQPLQYLISEPMQPWLESIVVSDNLQIYIAQGAGGELLMGASPDCHELHQPCATFEFTATLAAQLLDLFPSLAAVNAMRHCGGLAEMTADGMPIMGTTPITGFYLDAGWGMGGDATQPLCGKTLAHTVATGQDHALIASFNLNRFARVESSALRQ